MSRVLPSAAPGQSVLFYGGSVEYFRDILFKYPTHAEAYKVAALDGLNKLIRGATWQSFVAMELLSAGLVLNLDGPRERNLAWAPRTPPPAGSGSHSGMALSPRLITPQLTGRRFATFST